MRIKFNIIKRIGVSTLFSACFLVSCQNFNDNKTSQAIHVSILPLRSIVERITEKDFPVEVIVPQGQAVESYELNPKQYGEIARSQLIFNTGLLQFEKNILDKLRARDKIVNLSENIPLLAGECEHSHCSGHGGHGVDPHIWTSPKALLQIARNCYEAISQIYPDSSRYAQNFIKLEEELLVLDRDCAQKIEKSGMEYLYIYHPALTYFARDYGIEQVAIENEGKEPSAKHLAKIIKQGRAQNVKSILYQSQYPKASVDVVAQDLGAEAIVFDPLSEDVIGNIRNITSIITAK